MHAADVEAEPTQEPLWKPLRAWASTARGDPAVAPQVSSEGLLPASGWAAWATRGARAAGCRVCSVDCSDGMLSSIPGAAPAPAPGSRIAAPAHGVPALSVAYYSDHSLILTSTESSHFIATRQGWAGSTGIVPGSLQTVHAFTGAWSGVWRILSAFQYDTLFSVEQAGEAQRHLWEALNHMEEAEPRLLCSQSPTPAAAQAAEQKGELYTLPGRDITMEGSHASMQKASKLPRKPCTDCRRGQGPIMWGDA